MNSRQDPVDDPARLKLAAEIEKLQAETRLLRRPWLDPRGVLIPLLGAVIGLGSWWQSHITNQKTKDEAEQVEKDRNQLRAKVQELQSIADQQRIQLASAGAAGGSVAAAVQEVDAIRQNLRAIGERGDRQVIDGGRPAQTGVAAPVAERTAATLYVQVATDEQRREWTKRNAIAKELGFDVPGIEVVGTRAPGRTEVRYFHDTEQERQLAAQLVAGLKERTGTDATAKYVRGYESRTKANTLELWIAP